MDAAGEDTAVADEGVSVGQAGCVAGKLERRSSALHLTPRITLYQIRLRRSLFCGSHAWVMENRFRG